MTDRRDDGRILAIDTATTRVVVAVGSTAGAVIDIVDWPAGFRHGETLLPAVDDILGRLGVDRAGLAAVVVGTGPGAFTGLRVGIATAKGVAHAVGCPIVGVSTAAALLAGSGPDAVLLLPAGPSDRLVVTVGGPARLLPSGSDPDLAAGAVLVAVDLARRAPDDAVARGETARASLGAALVALGAGRLASGDVDDLARLVPEYVTLPRGVAVESGEVAWSHDRP